MNALYLLATLFLAVSGCSDGVLTPGASPPPTAAATAGDLDAIVDLMNANERYPENQQAAAHDADALAPFVRFVAADNDLAGLIAEGFCTGTGDPNACIGHLARHTEAAQDLGLDVRAVGLVSVEYERALGSGGVMRCPPPPDFDPGPFPPLDRAVSVVTARIFEGRRVPVIETYAYTGDEPSLGGGGEVRVFEVPPVGVEAEGPLMPEAYAERWVEANAEAVIARYRPGHGPTGPLCIPGPDW